MLKIHIEAVQDYVFRQSFRTFHVEGLVSNKWRKLQSKSPFIHNTHRLLNSVVYKCKNLQKSLDLNEKTVKVCDKLLIL